MPSFQPRQFPPPSLGGVPIEYIVQQLHGLADNYWDKPETADCTIIVPFPHALGRPELPAFSQTSVIEPAFSYAPTYELTNLGRRATQPPLNAVPRISLPLHIDYLAAHSSYLRGLFSGALSLDLMYSSDPPSASSSNIPPDRLPRLMPCSPDHPILFLPVPDPSSIHLLVHWMYFGDFTFIQECLHQGSIQWEGIARNVEYLGLSADIKIFLGNWYYAWLNPDRQAQEQDTEGERGAESEAGNDSDTIFSDSDSEDSCSTASDLDDRLDDDAMDGEKAEARAAAAASLAEYIDVALPIIEA